MLIILNGKYVISFEHDVNMHTGLFHAPQKKVFVFLRHKFALTC